MGLYSNEQVKWKLCKQILFELQGWHAPCTNLGDKAWRYLAELWIVCNTVYP
jgi:hypothetical protein